MLLSMTGHGEAHCQRGTLAVTVEVRTINSRYFKLSLRCPEGYNWLESRIEPLVRQHVHRGTIQVNCQIDRAASPDDFQLNEVVLRSYRSQLEQLCGTSQPVRLEALLALPGVITQQQSSARNAEQEWTAVAEALRQALQQLAHMRSEEGQAMAADLLANARVIADHLQRIRARAPLVVDAYRERLTERLNRLLAEYQVTISAADVVREVGVFAERSDISEELVRLASHLDQFESMMGDREPNGRKLDFLTQEMFREANTIGSKANDAEIARHVIEAKAIIERMREMIQNVE